VTTERVGFYSEGARLSGFLHRPDAADGRLPFVVQGPGWLGLADALDQLDREDEARVVRARAAELEG